VGGSQTIEIEGKRLKLTNLEKILYPAAGFTKGQVIDYYARIAPVLVPQLRGRPLTLKRYPEGVDQEFFFEKNATQYRPEWVKTAPIWSEGNRRTVNYLLADDLPTLLWIANLASIELHPSLSLARKIDEPTVIAFDLDPGPPATIVECCQVALWLRDIFAHLGLESFPKTSGSKGLQIYVPMNGPITYAATKPFAHALARLLEEEHPELVLSDMSKERRANKVFVDWSQNDQHKTTIAVYSLRARPHPTVSTPVTWEEVERAWKKRDASLLVFEANQVLERMAKKGDLFEPVLTVKQRLPKLPGIAEARPEAIESELGGQSAAAQARGSPDQPSPSGRTRSATRKKARKV